MLIFHYLLSFMVFSSNGQVKPDCPLKLICLGHSTNRVSQSQGDSVSSILQDAYEQFCGCWYIEDNIVIRTGSGLVDISQPLVEANFSFLYYVKEISGYLELNNIPSIERLSLPNLRLIHGRNLHSGRYSLLVSGRIETLYMPRLTEISRGDVLLGSSSLNSYLCNTRSINWTDIAPFPVSGHQFSGTDGCSDIVSFNCNCNNSRCFRDGQNIHCCHPECVAGCSGYDN
uniref:Receptor L-domain domain-containing protein n=1 Tax=Amphimedon queenslandica TaxID=400682 RepID=A0A1X7SEW3_AMPQE